jgi:hypothetical protein
VIPGFEETLRVNGRASVVRDADALERTAVRGKRPAVAIGIEVEECFLHCAKAFKRSRIWDAEGWPERSALPSLGSMFRGCPGFRSDQQTGELAGPPRGRRRTAPRATGPAMAEHPLHPPRWRRRSVHRQEARDRRPHRLPLQGSRRAPTPPNVHNEGERPGPLRAVPPETLERGMPKRQAAPRGDPGAGEAEASEAAVMVRFAAGLKKDLSAVRAGLTERWNNGPVEGFVHKLKLIKRQGYGRASFDLLRARVLAA